MEVLNIEEHADGSATLHLEMTDEEAERILEITNHKFYLEEAILHILEKSIDSMAKEYGLKDITENKKEKQDIIYINAIIVVNGKRYDVRAYNINMTAGTVVGFIEDITRKIDGYTDYEIFIPIGGTNCDWSFSVMLVRTSPDTLKFYSSGDE